MCDHHRSAQINLLAAVNRLSNQPRQRIGRAWWSCRCGLAVVLVSEPSRGSADQQTHRRRARHNGIGADLRAPAIQRALHLDLLSDVDHTFRRQNGSDEFGLPIQADARALALQQNLQRRHVACGRLRHKLYFLPGTHIPEHVQMDRTLPDIQIESRAQRRVDLFEAVSSGAQLDGRALLQIQFPIRARRQIPRSIFRRLDIWPRRVRCKCCLAAG